MSTATKATRQCTTCCATEKSAFTKTQWKLPLYKSRKCKACQLEDQLEEQAWKDESEEREIRDFFGLDTEDELEFV